MIDYHDFTTIDTPEWERRKIGVGDLWVNATTCKDCGDYVRSANRHDFRSCSCGAVSVDGGSWYAKRSFREGARFVDEIVPYADIQENL